MTLDTSLRAQQDNPDQLFQGNLFAEPEGSEQEQLLADYRQRYGLAEDPFADDYSFPLFTAAGQRDLLDRLLHLCQFSNSLLVLLGEEGSGKTRIAHAFLDSLAEQDNLSFLPITQGQGIAQVLPALVEDLELAPEQMDIASLQACVEAFIAHEQPESEGLAVVVMDNAHLLDKECLQWLMDLLAKYPQQQRLHFLLCGVPQLLDRLDAIKPADVLINDFYLQPFTLTEAVDYLNFRMEMADYLGPEIFTEAMVSPWWRQAQGHLGHLHDCAQEKLLASVAPQEKPRVAGGLPVFHILAISAVLAVVGVLFLYLGEDKPPAQVQSLPAPAPIASVQPTDGADVKPIMPSLPDAAANSAVQGQMTESQSQAVNQVNQARDLDQLVNSLPDSGGSIAPSDAETSVQPSANIVNSVPDTQPSPNTKIVQAKPVVQEPEVKYEVKPAVTPKLVETKPAASSKSAQEQKILSWSASSYTIQLLGVSNQKAAQDYIAQQSNKAQLLLFKSKRLGKDWYVVIVGNYASIAQARSAIEGLPGVQRKAGPWPRQLGAIQQEIRAAN